MDKTLEQRIRERAHEIWLATGRSDGQAEAHWLTAEREVLATLMAEAPAPQPAAKAATTRKPRSRATPTAKSQARAVAH
jgi:Protein of unknown function (DUF2934)